jgi:two-component system, chemotaxis family, sensor kinase CheA
VTGKVVDQLVGSFREEARERVAELESTLLELEDKPDDPELVARAFRALHTLKGNGRMFGFDDMASFVHEIETTFDHVRKGQLAASHQLIGLALNSLDLITLMMEGRDVEPGLREGMMNAFREILPATTMPSAAPAPEHPMEPSAEPVAGVAPSARTYRVRFEPDADLLRNGTNPLAILDELHDLGRCLVSVRTSEVPPLEDLNPESCYLAWDIVLTTTQDERAIHDAFMFVEGRCKLEIEQIDDGKSTQAPDYMKLGEILVERGDAPAEAINSVLESQKRIGDLLSEKGVVVPEVVQSAVIEQQAVREVRAQRNPSGQPDNPSSIRVAADKLDQLVDLVGELVISQARLAQTANLRNDEELRSIAENLERLSTELRDNTLDIRMVPIGTTFSRFRRLVRDLSSELGKDIELTTEGAETELDKTVIERIGDPLVHLIRNSCDHGVETPSVRIAKGKPGRGTVRLSAYHSGDSVTIEVADDGAGLDVETIRAKGQERGLIGPDDRLTEKEIFNLIFLPGFSTAKIVSSVSGRGVGMDVVKRSIEALRGSVDIESRTGQGTTIRLKLPLTLAIIEGLLVAVGDACYVLPMSAVEGCVELTDDDVAQAQGSHLANVRGELVPYIRLREWFGVAGGRPGIEQIAIAHAQGLRIGLVVDHVVGQHQTVLKSLGKMFKDVQELSGATIMGDGNVALIIDVNTLVKSVAESTDGPLTHDQSKLGPPLGNAQA